MMNKMYPLEWFDSLILQTLNPKKSNIKDLSENDFIKIEENVLNESKKIQIQLKNEVFSIRKKRQIRLLIRKYHSNLVYLLDRMAENQKCESFTAMSISGLCTMIMYNLEELLSFVEERFPIYLSLDERIPITYLLVSKNEIMGKIEKLQQKRQAENFHDELLGIVIQKLFQTAKSFGGSKITYRHILYQKELLKSLESHIEESGEIKNHATLDELLIGLNFNCGEYINYFINHINEELNEATELEAKMNLLHLYYKEFCQLRSNERISFDATQHHIKYVLDNWFRHELAFLEKQMSHKVATTEKNGCSAAQNILNNKIECILSTDQMGIILRATDESRVVKARSMSLVFKSIVPYLSTPFKKNLSYQSVRSKSYNAEERDKQIAIQTLEKIIKKIRTY